MRKFTSRLFNNTSSQVKEGSSKTNYQLVVDAFMANIGTIATFTCGAAIGSLLFSQNFTVEKGNMKFSTNNQTHALALLETTFHGNIDRLQRKSKEALTLFETEGQTPEKRKEIAEKTMSFYLAPTSHTKLFGKDVVIFNGKGYPTILKREEFDDIQSNWKKVLSGGHILSCADSFKIGADHSAWDPNKYREACQDCLQKFK